MTKLKDHRHVNLTDEDIDSMIKRCGEMTVGRDAGYVTCPHTQKRHEILIIERCLRGMVELKMLRKRLASEPYNNYTPSSVIAKGAEIKQKEPEVSKPYEEAYKERDSKYARNVFIDKGNY